MLNGMRNKIILFLMMLCLFSCKATEYKQFKKTTACIKIER